MTCREEIRLGKFGCRWEENIKMNFKVTGCENVVSIKMAQDRDQWRSLVNTVMKFQAP
jgi:hypothetical protein